LCGKELRVYLGTQNIEKLKPTAAICESITTGTWWPWQTLDSSESRRSPQPGIM